MAPPTILFSVQDVTATDCQAKVRSWRVGEPIASGFMQTGFT